MVLKTITAIGFTLGLTCFVASLVGLAVCTVAPYTPYFIAEALCAFYIQYTLLMALAGGVFVALLVLAILTKQPKKALYGSFLAASLLCLATQIEPMTSHWPWAYGPQGEVAHPMDDMVRVVQHNMWGQNARPETMAQTLSRLPADILTLEELDPDMLGALQQTPSFQARYPYQAGGANYGQMIFSRWPIVEQHMHLSRTLFPVLRAKIQHPSGRVFTVVQIHPPHPTKAYKYQEQQDVFAQVEALRPLLDGPFIVAGDLNATPFSPLLISFKQRLGLVDYRDGRGGFPTWPSFLPTALRVPIDYAMASPGLSPVDQALLPSTGSDHLPLWVRFKLQ